MPEAVYTIPISAPIDGLDKYNSPHEMNTKNSPNIKNFVCFPSYVVTRAGYTKIGSNLPLCIDSKGDILCYKDARGDNHIIVLTDRFAYEYNASSGMWEAITGATTVIEDGEDTTDWAAGSDITLTADGTIYKVGSKSLKMVAGDAIAADSVLATQTRSTAIGTKLNAVSFWFYTTQANLQLKLKLTGSGVAQEFYLTLATVAVNTWYFVICYAATTTLDTPLTKLEIINASIMNKNSIIYVDDIRVSETLPFSGDRWAYSTAHDDALGANNGGKVLVISNAQNGTTDIGLKYYEGHAGDYFKAMTTDPATIEAVKELCEFWNHLLLANYSESSVFNVDKFKYSATGNIDDFAGGVSGTRTLTDLIGKVLRIIKLGYSAFIFATNSIASLQYIGGTNIFSTPTETPEIGLFACKAVAQIQSSCFFLDTNKAIQVISSSNISSIGMLVDEFLFNDIDHSNKEKTVLFVDTITKRVFIVYPSTDGYNRRYISFDYRTNDKFEYGEFSDDIISACTAAITTTYYCDSPIFSGIYCDELTVFCDDYTSRTGKDITLLLSKDGYVYSMASASLLDDGVVVTDCIIETPDIYRKEGLNGEVLVEENLDRFIEVILRFKNLIGSSSARIYYSYDLYIDDAVPNNTVWTEFESSPITITTKASRFNLPLDIRARRIRIKIVCSASNKTYYLGGSVKLVPGTSR